MKKFISWATLIAGAIVGAGLGIAAAWVLLFLAPSLFNTRFTSETLVYVVSAVVGAIIFGGILWLIVTRVEGLRQTLDTDEVTTYLGNLNISADNPSEVSPEELEKRRGKQSGGKR